MFKKILLIFFCLFLTISPSVLAEDLISVHSIIDSLQPICKLEKDRYKKEIKKNAMETLSIYNQLKNDCVSVESSAFAKKQATENQSEKFKFFQEKVKPLQDVHGKNNNLNYSQIGYQFASSFNFLFIFVSANGFYFLPQAWSNPASKALETAFNFESNDFIFDLTFFSDFVTPLMIFAIVLTIIVNCLKFLIFRKRIDIERELGIFGVNIIVLTLFSFIMGLLISLYNISMNGLFFVFKVLLNTTDTPNAQNISQPVFDAVLNTNIPFFPSEEINKGLFSSVWDTITKTNLGDFILALLLSLFFVFVYSTLLFVIVVFLAKFIWQQISNFIKIIFQSFIIPLACLRNQQTLIHFKEIINLLINCFMNAVLLFVYYTICQAIVISIPYVGFLVVVAFLWQSKNLTEYIVGWVFVDPKKAEEFNKSLFYSRTVQKELPEATAKLKNQIEQIKKDSSEYWMNKKTQLQQGESVLTTSYRTSERAVKKTARFLKTIIKK